MPAVAEARVETERGSRWLEELCQAVKRRADANPEIEASAEWSEANGTIEFGWGRCTLHATPGVLALRVEAVDQDGLDQLRELITRHLEKLGSDEQLTVGWQQAGAPVDRPDDARHGRDGMRRFHRRVRHGS